MCKSDDFCFTQIIMTNDRILICDGKWHILCLFNFLIWCNKYFWIELNTLAQISQIQGSLCLWNMQKYSLVPFWDLACKSKNMTSNHWFHFKLASVDALFKKTNAEIRDLERTAESLRRAIFDKEAPMKVAQTRLDERNKRIHVELCNDNVMTG